MITKQTGLIIFFRSLLLLGETPVSASAMTSVACRHSPSITKWTVLIIQEPFDINRRAISVNKELDSNSWAGSRMGLPPTFRPL